MAHGLPCDPNTTSAPEHFEYSFLNQILIVASWIFFTSTTLQIVAFGGHIEILKVDELTAIKKQVTVKEIKK